MEDKNNIKSYIGKATELFRVLGNETDVKKKFGYFNIAFPTIQDKVICKAIFDAKYRDTKQCAFLDSMMKEISEVTETYNEVAAYILNKKQKEEKKISDQGSENRTAKYKQGTTIEANGRIDEFSNASKIKSETVLENSNKSNNKEKEEIKRNGKIVIKTVDKKAIEQERINMATDFGKKEQERQDAERKRKEEEARKKYEEDLKRRTKTAENVSKAQEIQNMISKM